MSKITDVILIVHTINEFEKRKVKFLNLYLQSENHSPLELSTADGGEKVFVPRLYVGAFRMFDHLAFINQVKLNFDHPDDAYQVFIRDEDLYQFEIKAVKVPKWI